jgi:hypothetical protein
VHAEAGAAGAEIGGTYAAAAPVLYTQAQLDRAVSEAKAQPRAGSADQYCWLHGYNRSHIGLACTFIKAGRSIRVKRDSRAPLADTMVFDRPGCITVEQANEAAGPLTIPRHPGNAIRPGDKPYTP